jgi:hypothetical protein
MRCKIPRTLCIQRFVHSKSKWVAKRKRAQKATFLSACLAFGVQRRWRAFVQEKRAKAILNTDTITTSCTKSIKTNHRIPHAQRMKSSVSAIEASQSGRISELRGRMNQIKQLGFVGHRQWNWVLVLECAGLFRSNSTGRFCSTESQDKLGYRPVLAIRRWFRVCLAASMDAGYRSAVSNKTETEWTSIANYVDPIQRDRTRQPCFGLVHVQLYSQKTWNAGGLRYVVRLGRSSFNVSFSLPKWKSTEN